MSADPAPARPLGGALFSFVQIEVPWPLGPPEGRYVLRAAHPGQDAAISHVAVLATVAASERRRRPPGRRARTRSGQPEPAPTPAAVDTGRATIVDVERDLGDAAAARTWLRCAGEAELRDGLEVVNRILRAFRLVTADPHVGSLARRQLIAARVGYGAGEQVADGRWTDARELGAPGPGGRAGRTGAARRRALAPQAQLAAMLGARRPALACEELVLRARVDLDEGRPREAALQVLVALDAALAELAVDPQAPLLAPRLGELRGQRAAVGAAAQMALAGAPSAAEQEAVAFTIERIEAALRARVAAGD